MLCDIVPLQVDTQKQFSVTLQPYLYAFVHIARLLFACVLFVPKKLYLLIEMVYHTIHVSETDFLTWLVVEMHIQNSADLNNIIFEQKAIFTTEIIIEYSVCEY